MIRYAEHIITPSSYTSSLYLYHCIFQLIHLNLFRISSFRSYAPYLNSKSAKMRLTTPMRGIIAGSRRPSNARTLRTAVRQQQRSLATQSKATVQIATGFWTTTRVALLTATAGSLAYLAGISDTGSYFRSQDGTTLTKPVYAKKKDLEAVRQTDPRTFIQEVQ